MRTDSIRITDGFFTGDMQAGIEKICKYYGLPEKEEAIPVLKFTLHLKGGDASKDVIVNVGKGGFKTAGLLMLLAGSDLAKATSNNIMHAIGYDVLEVVNFYYTKKMQAVVRSFFGSELRDDAENNSLTTHATLRRLLEDVDFWIELRIVNLQLLDKLFDMLLNWKNKPDYRHYEVYLTEPYVLLAMQIARDLHARGTIPVLHELLREEVVG